MLYLDTTHLFFFSNHRLFQQQQETRKREGQQEKWLKGPKRRNRHLGPRYFLSFFPFFLTNFVFFLCFDISITEKWPPTPCWWQEHDNDDGGLETQMHLKSQVSFLFLFRYHDTCELSQQQTTYTMTAPSLARNVRWRGIFLQCFPTVRGRTLAGIPYLLYIFYFHFALLTYLFVTVWLLPYFE